MQDLEIAKRRLKEKGLTLSIVKGNEIIFESSSHGISGFLEAIERLRDRLERASVADRVVGKAIALLCIHAKVKAVYASILSKRGKVVFEEYAVYHELDDLVESIFDTRKGRICLFEKLAIRISDPAEAYQKLRALQHSVSTH